MIKNNVYVILSTIRKNRAINKSTYPISMIFQRVVTILGAFILPLVMYIFVFNSNLSDEFLKSTKTSDYLSYLTLGQGFLIIIVATLMNVGRAIITEYRQNTLVNLLYSPASVLSFLFGVFMEQFMRTMIEFFSILIIGIILGANISLTQFFILLFFIIISSLAGFSIGVVTSAIMLKTRDTFITQNILMTVISLICGITVPIGFLPEFVQGISLLLPLTHLLIAFRNCVILNQSLYENRFGILIATILTVIYTFIGDKALKRVMASISEII